MPVAEQPFYLLLRLIAAHASIGGDHHEAQPRLPSDLLLQSRERDNNRVILIFTHRWRLTFGHQHTHYHKGQVANADHLTYRLRGGKKILAYRVPNYGDISSGGYI